jgi:ubiquinone biosynthesis protein
MDLTLEGASTERFAMQFKDDDGIMFPEVYWEATTRGVLTLEEIHGTSLSGINPESLASHDRRAIVENGARAVLRQCLEFGFFHADPHPGNIFALPGGRVCFIDCGMTGHIDEKTQQQLADLVAGVVTGDAERVIAVVGALCDADPSKLEERAFRTDVREFISNFKDTPLERLNMGSLLGDFFDKLRLHHIRCPADLVLLIKALSTIEAVGASLDPKFDMVGYARPYVEKLVGRKYGMAALRKRLEAGVMRYAELAEDLPNDVRFLITQVKRNRLAVNLEHKGLSRLTQTIEHASRNISFALIIAAMLVGSAILVLADRNSSIGVLTFLGVAGFLAAAVLVVLIVITNRRLKDRE